MNEGLRKPHEVSTTNDIVKNVTTQVCVGIRHRRLGPEARNPEQGGNRACYRRRRGPPGRKRTSGKYVCKDGKSKYEVLTKGLKQMTKSVLITTSLRT